MVQFASLQLATPLLRALSDEGYHTPTPIQNQAIPPVLEGRDLLGCAQTGTGKTAAFALPILHRLVGSPRTASRRGTAIPRVLILAPTRELASQIDDSFGAYGRHTGLTHTVIFGGVSQFHQVRAIERGIDILVATPGRLLDLMEQRLVDLSGVRILVLDEADRMLDMGFIQPIRRIAAALPAERQTLLFSATMPREILGLAESLLRNPVRVAVTPVASATPLIDQTVYFVPRQRKQALLELLLNDETVERAVVFTRTKHGADRVTRKLNQGGISADAIHGNKAQNRRERALDGFRNGKIGVLVATDVAARGLDVDGITHVFNFDLPNEPEAYVHRIGRTGRAGATGRAIAFCDSEERSFLRDIERLIGKPVPVTPLPDHIPESAAPADPSPERQERPARGRGQGGSGGRRQPHGGGQPSRGNAPRGGTQQSGRTSNRGGNRSAGHHTTARSDAGHSTAAPSPATHGGTAPVRSWASAGRGRSRVGRR